MRASKWVMLVFAVATCIGWVRSYRVSDSVEYDGPAWCGAAGWIRGVVAIGGGRPSGVIVHRGWHYQDLPGSSVRSLLSNRYQVFEIANVGVAHASGRWVLMFPLWCVAGAFATISLLQWKRDKAMQAVDGKSCEQCGYDLTGNESGVCPECGKAIEEVAK